MSDLVKTLISVFFLISIWWAYIKIGEKYNEAGLSPYSPELPNWVVVTMAVLMILLHFGVIIFLGYA